MRKCVNVECKCNNLWVVASHVCSVKSLKEKLFQCQNPQCVSFQDKIRVWHDTHRCFHRNARGISTFLYPIWNELDTIEYQIRKLKESLKSQELISETTGDMPDEHQVILSNLEVALQHETRLLKQLCVD